MKECPFCGTKIKDETKPCPDCGYTMNPAGEILGDAKEIDSQIIEEKNEPTVNADNKLLPTWIKVLLVVFTLFLSPLIGLIGSIILLSNQNASYKSFGIKLLVITVIFFIVAVIANVFGAMALFLGGNLL